MRLQMRMSYLSIAKKLSNINKNGLEHCNMETGAYIWFTAI